MFRLGFFGVLCVLALAGCATAYSPQTALTGNGYSETRVAVNVWEVKFEGNTFTEREKAADMALLRSAELMEEHGFRYFVAGGSEVSEETAETARTTTVHTSFVGITTRTEIQKGDDATAKDPSVTTMVAGFADKPDCPGPVYRTASVLKVLRAKYQS